MKKSIWVFLALVLLTGISRAAISLPDAETFKLANGLTVNVIERHQLPLFSIKLTFRAGSIYDPVGKEGLASLTNEMLMKGTATRTASQIADEIAFGGGTLYNTCSQTAAGFQGEFLSEYGEKGFELLADIIKQAALATEEFDKAKTLTLGNLQSRRENPRAVAGDAIIEAILGQNRFAHQPGGTTATVSTLSREDVIKFAAGHYTPDNCLLVVCGDITPKLVRQWVEKYLGGWSGRTVPEDVATAFPPVSGRTIMIYDKDDATQTQIRIGGSGIPLNHPDAPALDAVGTIYGGSFSSRLVDEIRVNRGLTYNVSFQSQSHRPGGIAYVSTFTKNASVGEVLDIILAEADRLQTVPVSDSELADAVAYQCGTYPMEFETSDDLANVFTAMWLNDLDKSYYEDYQERLMKVTPSQAMEAARKYFARNEFKLILVGKAQEIKSQVAKFGPVLTRPFKEN